MTTRNMTQFFLLLASVLGFSNMTWADSWRLPEREVFYSPNGRYRLETIPKKIGSQLYYFSEKAGKSPDVGARKGDSNSLARGVFSLRGRGGRYKRLARFRLLNEVAPVSALVSDSGQYFVTFDNWHMLGHGEDVVVIYRADGSVINSLGLSDFLTDEDIEELPRTISSIRWHGEHFIDESNELLVLRVVACQRKVFSCDRFVNVSVSLKTGLPINPKSNHLPKPRVFFVSESRLNADDIDGHSIQPVCNPGMVYSEIAKKSKPVTAEELIGNIVGAPLPPYPELARKARVEGSVVLEVAVSGSGNVGCVKVLRGLSFGISDELLSAALEWGFDPSLPGPIPAPFVGRLTVEYRWVPKGHPAY